MSHLRHPINNPFPEDTSKRQVCILWHFFDYLKMLISLVTSYFTQGFTFRIRGLLFPKLLVFVLVWVIFFVPIDYWEARHTGRYWYRSMLWVQIKKMLWKFQIKGHIGIIYKLYNNPETVIWERFHSKQHVVKLQNNSPKTKNRISVSAGYESTPEHLMFTYCKIWRHAGQCIGSMLVSFSSLAPGQFQIEYCFN